MACGWLYEWADEMGSADEEEAQEAEEEEEVEEAGEADAGTANRPCGCECG